MKILAMIPARMGSKRIPKKNIRIFGDKPLMAHAILQTVTSGVFSEVWVNTEDSLLGNIGLEYGAYFHQRPKKLSSDTATNQHFVKEFLEKHPCDFVVMINTTSPLISTSTIKRFVNAVLQDRFDTVLSVVSENTECFFQESPLNFRYDRKLNSQNIEPVKRVVWALTAWKRKTFLETTNQCPSFCGNVSFFEIPKLESFDIDTLEDWEMALATWELRNKKGYANK